MPERFESFLKINQNESKEVNGLSNERDGNRYSDTIYQKQMITNNLICGQYFE